MNSTNGLNVPGETWPALPYEAWKETYETLHMWTQVIGKIRLTLSPYMNHWWQVPLYVTARGLTTSPIPYENEMFEIDFDFIDHNLLFLASNGSTKSFPLRPRSVADFYREVMATLRDLGIEVAINTLPCEIAHPIRFEKDTVHAAYDPAYAHRFWRILLQTEKVLLSYRSQFIGKASPIHFFWGSFDLALSFFSGRSAPERKDVDPITREAYSHEVISCGFWPGNASFPKPAFYSYIAPPPTGLEKASIRPDVATYSQEMGEYLLLYDNIRSTHEPAQMLLDFCQSTYKVQAQLANWDLSTLEKKEFSTGKV